MSNKQEVINLGSYNVPTSFDDINLSTWSDYARYTSECEEKEEDLDAIKILEILSNIPRDTVMQMPVEMFDNIFEKLSFLNEDISKIEPSPFIKINDETYQINFLEKLKTKEYLDVTTVLDSDKHNYSTVLAILCRKEEEIYNDDFIANDLNSRIEMFNNISVKQALPLIGFFLTLSNKSQILSRNYSIIHILQEETTEFVRHFEDSLKVMDCFTPSKLKAIMTLRNLKRLLKRI